jgi:sugar lactone lactonase YvrE
MNVFRCSVHVGILGLISLIPTANAAETYAWSTFAGMASEGYGDGVGTSALFAHPEAIAVDNLGYVYVADSDNYVVRKIAPDGTVSTLAGAAGQFGIIDATGSDARFGGIYGIAVDKSRNVYVSDVISATVRRITPAGVVTTYAGSGTSGYVDGVRTAAQFNGLAGLAVDSAGNVYVADSENYVIRKIATDGTVTTFAGKAGVQGTADGVGSAARFTDPYGLAVDATGNVYVSDWDNATIRKITPNGTVTTIAGTANNFGSSDGFGTAATFETTSGVAVDAAGAVYVTDRYAQTIRKIDSAGNVTSLAGRAYIRGYADGSGTSARFFNPTAVAVDSSGVLYVADTYNSSIRKITATGAVTTFAGSSHAGTADGIRANARFLLPAGLTIASDGTAYVADSYNHTVRKITPQGVVTTVAGKGGVSGSVDGTAADARFAYPQAVAVDSTGNLFVPDYNNNTIRKITPTGLVGTVAGLSRAGGSDDGAGQNARFYGPNDIVLAPDGTFIIADSLNNTIRRMTTNGVVTTIAGQVSATGATDGPAASAKFNYPASVAVDQNGNIFVADYGNHSIREISATGNVTTFAGQSGTSGDTDGTGSAARFLAPARLTIDKAGNLYVADTGNHEIRKITAAGVVTTIGGYGFPSSGDGLGTDALFSYPEGIAVDAAGDVYVADSYNSTIRKGGLVGVDSPSAQLANLSVRANLAANQRLITGFVVGGGSKDILVRAIGPGLIPFLGGAIAAGDPRLEMYDSALNLVQSNEDWGGDTTLSALFDKLQAFPLPPTSKDAAAVRSISGSQSVHVLSPTAGIALVEAYDAGSGSTARLINVSARYHVGTGADALSAGFVILGSGSKTVLIRGVGPTLSEFGVSGALTNPHIELYTSDHQKIAENDDWNSALVSTFDKVQAFQFVLGSKDSALLINLTEGVYSATLTGVNGGTGEGMIEVYEVGN